VTREALTGPARAARPKPPKQLPASRSTCFSAPPGERVFRERGDARATAPVVDLERLDAGARQCVSPRPERLQLHRRSTLRDAVCLGPARPQAACADLSALSTGSSTIVAAEAIAGTDGVPEHCRISGLIAPQIRFEIDLPSAWNRRFYMYGNGGFAGETPAAGSRLRLRAAALLHGFATASTNTGHDASTRYPK
jgi:hypothetical protein